MAAHGDKRLRINNAAEGILSMTSFPHSFEFNGELVEVDFKELTQMQPKPAVLACVKFGPERLWSNDNEVNFVNEIYVKMPFNTYGKQIEKFTPGALVRIKGRLQGVQKHGDGAFRVELLAEKVSFSMASESR